jgi:hypothetical protein
MHPDTLPGFKRILLFLAITAVLLLFLSQWLSAFHASWLTDIHDLFFTGRTDSILVYIFAKWTN